jgi:hypothetical protein
MRRLIQSLCTLSGIAILSGCASAPPVTRSLASNLALDTATWPVDDDIPKPTEAEPYLVARAPSKLATPEPQFDSTLLLIPVMTPTPAPMMPTPAGEDEDRNGTNYLSARGGVFYPKESDLDSGYIVNLAFGRYFTRFLSLEFEGGYLAPDPDVSSVDLYGVPLMLNARLNLPLWILEAYGGVGGGATYYSVDGPGFSSDGWLWTGSAFLGANLVLFDKLTGGVEVKYYLTEEMRNTHDSLGGLAAMLTLGFRF